MDDDAPEQWLTVEQVAGTLQVSQETVRRWIRNGELPVLDISGGRGGYRIKRSDLDAFIAARYGPIVRDKGRGKEGEG